MKKLLSKIKLGLATLLVTLISFFSKAIGQFGDTIDEWANPSSTNSQMLYWVPQPESKINIAMKIFPRLLIPVTLAFWIISFIKIRKIGDKSVKRKKIRNAVIIISILVILIVALILSTPLLTKYFS